MSETATLPASASVPDYENRCGNPDCRGAVDHAPNQVYLFVPHDAGKQAAMLAKVKGRH